MCYEWEGVKPDILCVGKALSGGTMPASAVFANDEIMLVIKPGEHGSTYGGNPLAMAVSRTAIQVLLEENMVENSLKMGEILADYLGQLNTGLIKEVRGRGLFRSIELTRDSKVDGHDLAYALKNNGLLTKATHNYTLRLAPALTATEKEITEACKKIKKGFIAIEKLNRERKREARQEKS